MVRADRHGRGFTLIELMIVVTLIAIVLSIAIPSIVAARLSANESATAASLRTLWIGQAQFQRSVYADVDHDGIGEFGFLRELSGLVGVRETDDGSVTGSPARPPPVSTAFGSVDANGAGERSGYRFRIVLPDVTGAGVHESPSGSFDGPVSADMAETTFCVYAWPAAHATTGNRTFFLGLSGDIQATDSSLYSGDTFYTNATDGAAFVLGTGPDDSITGQPAIGTVGRDSNRWLPVR